tara:strand:+ start:382 stop:753 length:372 start_codon:yes stop_codon:yes gene_type:complete
MSADKGLIILAASIGGVQSLKDKTIKLTFETQELKPEHAGVLFSMQNEYVSLGIARNDLTDKEIKLLSDSRLPIESIPNTKSKSQLLRNVLFRLGEQNGEKDSTLHYNNMMDMITNFYKAKLE